MLAEGLRARQTEFLWWSIRILNRPVSELSLRQHVVQGLWNLARVGETHRLRDRAREILIAAGEIEEAFSA